ncbi:hypothetical protein N474_05280 [Pseudoalteromonas luteoviolacea CPMOR-2]|uniref:hypothetical protein n=1 Tax=Pseudoalteromonas luteoviolacea TaxID=43657 RepID=UPI0007B0993E|nr:hypothetical protein [Pseudoalteromonas luteoviolacea]KZN49666.1 hypothetical protein N474_05280 [Pseudoalteromonas luteoviolacea CPMOR-2]
MIGKLTRHLQVSQEQISSNLTLKEQLPSQNKPNRVPAQTLNPQQDYFVKFESAEDKAQREANLEATLSRPIIFGFSKTYVRPQVTLSGLGTEHLNKSYQFGELTNEADIEDFLAQGDRFPPDQRHKFQHLKPTQELLELSKKLSDEDFAKFADIIVNMAEFNPKTGRFNNISEDLIDKFNSMSEETLSSTLHTMSHILEQGQAHDFSPYSSPAGILDAKGQEDALLNRYDKDHHIFSRSFGMQERANLNRYANIILDNKLTDEQLLELNAHIDESDYETNVGIIDMAKTIKPYQQDSFFAMLSEVDKSNNQNVFTLVSKQLDWREHKHYLQTDSEEYVINHDALTSERERQDFYSNLLNAFDQVGLGWMNEVIEFTFDTPAKSQPAIWHELIKDLEETPEDFIRSDSIESWVNSNIDSLVHSFIEQQIKDMHKYNETLDMPFNLSGLNYVAIDKNEGDEYMSTSNVALNQ